MKNESPWLANKKAKIMKVSKKTMKMSSRFIMA